MTIQWRQHYEQSAGRGGYDFDAVLAQRFDSRNMSGLLRQDLVIEPTEVAILVKDGGIGDAYSQTRLPAVGRGLMDGLKTLVGQGETRAVVLAKTAAFDLLLPVKTLTADGVRAQGVMTIRLRLTDDGATKVLDLMASRDLLTKKDLVDVLSRELDAFVTGPHGRQFDASKLQGNVEVQRRLEDAARVEMSRTITGYGFQVQRLFTNWETTEAQLLLELQGVLQTKDARRELETRFSERDLDRGAGVRIAGIWREGKVDLEQAKAEFERRLTESANRWELTNREAQGVARVGLTRVQGEIAQEQARHEERMRQLRDQDAREREQDRHDVELARLYGQLRVEQQRAESDIRVSEFQGRELASQQAERAHRQSQLDSLRTTMEATLAGIRADTTMTEAQKAAAIRDTMAQFTEMMALTQGADVSAQKYAAKTAEASLDTFRRGQMESRDYERQRADDDVRKMEAGKNPSSVVVPGMGPIVGPGTGRTCPRCGVQIARMVNFCESCGADLRTR